MPVNTPSKFYTDKSSKWERCRDVVGGVDAVKAKGTKYLPMLETHRALNPTLVASGGSFSIVSSAYESYKERALFYPAGRRTIQGLAGLLFGHMVSVEGVTKNYQEQLKDVTLTSVSMSSFALAMGIEILSVGRAGALLDMPQQDPVSSKPPRPYWVGYKTEQILSVRMSRIAGQVMLTRVVLEEDVEAEDPKDPYVTQTRKQWRVLLLDRNVYAVQVWRQADDDQKTVMLESEVIPLRRGTPLPFIPFVIAGPEGLVFSEIPDPPLLDLFDVNLSHYRTSADHEQGAHFTALPTPYVTGHALRDDEQLAVGAGVCWVFPNPQAQVGMLEFQGAGLKSLADLKEEKRQMMATLGARMLETQKNVQEAAETVRLRHAGEASALMVLAESLSLALSAMVRWHVYWSEASSDLEALSKRITVKLNPDVLSSLSPEEVRVLVSTWQAGAISKKTLYSNLEWGEYTRPGVSFEEEETEIESEGALDEPEPIQGDQDEDEGKDDEQQPPVDPERTIDGRGPAGPRAPGRKAGAR